MTRKIIIHYSTDPESPQVFWWQLEEWEKKERIGIVYESREFDSEDDCRKNIDLMKSIPRSASVEIYDGN